MNVSIACVGAFDDDDYIADMTALGKWMRLDESHDISNYATIESRRILACSDEVDLSEPRVVHDLYYEMVGSHCSAVERFMARRHQRIREQDEVVPVAGIDYSVQWLRAMQELEKLDLCGELKEALELSGCEVKNIDVWTYEWTQLNELLIEHCSDEVIIDDVIRVYQRQRTIRWWKQKYPDARYRRKEFDSWKTTRLGNWTDGRMDSNIYECEREITGRDSDNAIDPITDCLPRIYIRSGFQKRVTCGDCGLSEFAPDKIMWRKTSSHEYITSIRNDMKIFIV